MFLLVDYMLEKKIASTKGEAFEKIGFNQGNGSKIRSGRNKFTVEQITAACKITGANANWVLGLEENMMRKPAKKVIDQLREAVNAVASELNEK